MNNKEKERREREEWENNMLDSLIEKGREYEAGIFAEMLIKVLWVLQDE